MTPANASQRSDVPRAPSSNWVRIENERAGTSSWQIPATAKHGISGFADKVTVQRGADVRLYVDTTADSFKVRAYRMGYYQGLGGRKVLEVVLDPGDNQPNPTTDAGHEHGRDGMAAVDHRAHPQRLARRRPIC